MRKDGKGEGQAPRGGGVSAPCRVDKSVDRSRIGGNAKGRSPWKMKSVSVSVGARTPFDWRLSDGFLSTSCIPYHRPSYPRYPGDERDTLIKTPTPCVSSLPSLAISLPGPPLGGKHHGGWWKVIIAFLPGLLRSFRRRVTKRAVDNRKKKKKKKKEKKKEKKIF